VSLVIPRQAPGVTVRRVYVTVTGAVPTYELRAGVTPGWGEDPAGLVACLGAAGVSLTQPCAGNELSAFAAYVAAHPELAALNGVGVWAREAWRCEGAATLPDALTKAAEVLGVLVQPAEQPGTLPSACSDVAGARWRSTLVVTVVGAVDPNEKLGPTGTLSARQLLPYSIRFENLPTSTASAQIVRVVDELDLSVLDVSSLSLETLTIGGRTILPPPGLKQFATEVDLRPEMPLIVWIRASLDHLTGVLSWQFQSVDPSTGQPLSPSSILGFLPPNLQPPQGEGSVLFTVRTRADVAPGTEVRNRALLAFDAETPFFTSYWLNTLDNAAPASHVLPLPATQDSADFTVTWQATGAPPDLRDFTVYVSDDNAPYEVWRQSTTSTSANFTAQLGHQYRFYSTARDMNGNIESAPNSPDATTWATLDVEEGGPPLQLSLEGARPNPSPGTPQIWFTLPGEGPASLELLDVAGRRVANAQVGERGPGRHVQTLGEHVRPGIYWVRLSRLGERRVARVVVIRPAE
jgi:hypothetical protein